MRNGKTNLALKDVDGELVVISQFTLYADCKKGNRPSFIKAGNPELANSLYEYIISGMQKRTSGCSRQEALVQYMKVELINDGPFTIVLDSDELIK